MNKALMSLFRLTVIDYDYAPLQEVDSVMGRSWRPHEQEGRGVVVVHRVTHQWLSLAAPIMVVAWIFLSGILFINLFIAMMSNTFDVVADNAKEVAAMQKAEIVVEAMNALSPARQAK